MVLVEGHIVTFLSWIVSPPRIPVGLSLGKTSASEVVLAVRKLALPFIVAIVVVKVGICLKWFVNVRLSFKGTRVYGSFILTLLSLEIKANYPSF